VPFVGLGFPLVTAHHPDHPEPGLLVGPDRPGVRRRRVDRDPVVAPVIDQDPDHPADRLGPDPPAVEVRIEEDVDPGVPVPGLGLLGELDHPGHGPVDQDRQAGRPGVVGQRESRFGGPPPPGDPGGGVDAHELGRVLRADRPEDQLTAEHRDVRAATLSARR
jgi:hypothetical protein